MIGTREHQQSVGDRASGETSILPRPAAWLIRWGFADLVGLAAFAAAYLGWTVHAPQRIPDFALKAEAIYRLEIGVAAFCGLYLVILAFVLALHNRGFSDISRSGIKAEDLTSKAQQGVIEGQEESMAILRQLIDSIEDSTEASIDELEERLEVLESSRQSRLYLNP